MATLSTKIDFAVVLQVKNANPNGDPLNGNRPRVNYDGLGEISDVCIKRKIRNRLMQKGLPVFVQSDDNRVDEYESLRARADGELKNVDAGDEAKFRAAACKKWIDVRAFGQLFAFKGKAKKPKAGNEGEASKGDGVSVGIRGPVSVHPAFSILPVADRMSSIQITKSVNAEGDGSKRGSDTMGMKHRVDHGVYVFYGSMNPQLAEKTGFSDADADAIKDALVSLFDNDASSARPEGSMEVCKVYWWKHKSKTGQYSSAKVHRSLEIRPRPLNGEAKSIDDYEVCVHKLASLEPEVLDGR